MSVLVAKSSSEFRRPPTVQRNKGGLAKYLGMNQTSNQSRGTSTNDWEVRTLTSPSAVAKKPPVVIVPRINGKMDKKLPKPLPSLPISNKISSLRYRYPDSICITRLHASMLISRVVVVKRLLLDAHIEEMTWIVFPFVFDKTYSVSFRPEDNLNAAASGISLSTRSVISYGGLKRKCSSIFFLLSVCVWLHCLVNKYECDLPGV